MTTNDMVSLRPLVILAIRMMGPGRRRLEMVKLAHDLHDARGFAQASVGSLHVAVEPQPRVVPPQQRAA